MNLTDFVKSEPNPPKKLTLCFLVDAKRKKVLLARKKRGLGATLWNGPGGKVEHGENIEAAAIRETQEEIGVTPLDLQHKATLNFYYPGNNHFPCQVWAYLAHRWEGTAKETDEMQPKWFSYEAVPYSAMWEDDRLWLPLVLSGKKLMTSFLFATGDILIDYVIEEL